ncbi:hypothetical protein [Couchioplanes caeruleus]|uniref:hypothetical protein n=1 Tax=Couchioplanes caeruleus TaxID=56438 RepID=UPI000A4CACDC|nr:hypothetical protein [Couchioplanes caeruleus]
MSAVKAATHLRPATSPAEDRNFEEPLAKTGATGRAAPATRPDEDRNSQALAGLLC